MFEKLIRGTVKKRKVTISVMILSIFFGLISYYSIPKQESPDVTPPVAVLTCVYPGASAEDVESMVTSKIEESLKTVPSYNYSYSDSASNFSMIVLWLENDADPEKSWDYLRNEITDIQNELPSEALDIELNTEVADTSGIFLSVSSNNRSLEDLSPYSEKLKKKLMAVNGIAKFDIIGDVEKEVSIIVDYKKLNYYNLSISDISQILLSQNIEIPSGSISSNGTEINVKTPAIFNSFADIENTIINISSVSGEIVRLKDLATITWSISDDHVIIQNNGTPSILLAGYFNENQNVILIGDEIKTIINDYKKTIPADINIDITHFQPDDVRASVNKFMTSLILGIIMVIFIVFVGMSFRNAIIVSTVIPLSILFTFILMGLFNVKVHEISTTGLIIALGMLVDNAIVISDAIQTKIDNKVEKLTACVDGVRESAIPILSATLTTVATFIPLIMLTGPSGDYIFSIPFTVISALAISYLNAIFITPTLAFIFFKEKAESKKNKESLTRIFFRKLLSIALKKKKTAMLSSLGLVALAVILLLQIGFVFFPFTDKNLVYIDVSTSSFSTTESTSQTISEIENILSEQKEVSNYFSITGDGFPKFYVSMLKGSPANNFGQIMFKTDFADSEFERNLDYTQYLQSEIDSKLHSGEATVKLLEHSEPSEAIIKIRLFADDFNETEQASSDLIELIESIPGTVNVRHDLESKTLEYNVAIKPNIASRLGISKYDIQRDINTALKGSTASVYKDNGKEYDIIVKSNIDSVSDLENLSVKSSVTSDKIVFKQIADVSLVPSQSLIKHYNGERSITILSDVKAGYNTVRIENEIESKYIEAINNPNVTVSFDGEREKISKYFGDALKYAVLAIFIVYFILLIQFNSFSQPLIILYTIPLAVVGSIIGLFVFRTSLSFTALLGIISLIGIVVNNAILIIEFINHNRNADTTIEDAVLLAFNRRFRPIMLTTITTVAGLLPLAFSKSSLFVPMAIALISGLLIATLLTLVFIPVIYSIIENHKLKKAL